MKFSTIRNASFAVLVCLALLGLAPSATASQTASSQGLSSSTDRIAAEVNHSVTLAGDARRANGETHSAPSYKGVTYQPVCGKVGCINIVKKCTDNLKNCGIYWNTVFRGVYKQATGISLNYGIQVQGIVVYGPRDYGHTKNGNQKPLFHGSWGFNHPPAQWGEYSYPCYVVGTCTGYLKSTDAVKMGGTGSFKLNGDKKYFTLYGKWGEDTGRVVPWKGSLVWANLPS